VGATPSLSCSSKDNHDARGIGTNQKRRAHGSQRWDEAPTPVEAQQHLLDLQYDG